MTISSKYCLKSLLSLFFFSGTSIFLVKFPHWILYLSSKKKKKDINSEETALKPNTDISMTRTSENSEMLSPRSLEKITILLLLLSHFSRVRLFATPETIAHQAPPSLQFPRQEQWSGVPFPSPMHESEKWKWSCSVMSDSQRPHGLQPTRLLLLDILQ